MIDLEIRYPTNFDILPFTTTVSVNIGDNLNALRDSILNMQAIIGLDPNIGLFTPNPEGATISDRLNRIERGIAERNLVFREINVSDSLQVLLNQNNDPIVNIGLGSTTSVAPVNIRGPLTILSPQIVDPRTIIQTPVSIDVTTYDQNKSANSLIKGKANSLEPILRIHDTSDAYDSQALHVIGNMKVEGVLTAEYSIDHNTILNIDTVPTDATRGDVKHVTQGDFHSHRKGRYDQDRGIWIVDSSISTEDFGVLSHSDLQGWGTLPTHDNSFQPEPGVQYHVTGGDTHSHSKGDGAQIDHNDLKNISPKFSNHVTGGDSHRHTSSNDGGQISHTDLADINTSGANAVHVTSGNAHTHGVDSNGDPIGDGAQIDHNHLLNISPATSNHVTGGDNHTHSADGDGAQISHTDLSNVGNLTHEEIDAKISRFRPIEAGTATFTSSGVGYNEITISHTLGTEQFNVFWSISGANQAPPSNPFDIGVVYISDKTSSTFKLRRLFSGSSINRIYDSGETPANSLNDIIIPHGLGAVPATLEILHEINGAWEFLDPASYLRADTTNIYTNIVPGGSLVPLSTDTIRIVATTTTTTASSQPGPAIKAQAETAIDAYDNNDLLFIARTAGVAGNSISIKYEANDSLTSNPFIASSLNSIVVFFDGNNPPTASAVRLAILSDVTANTFVDVLNATGNDGSGAIDEVDEFFLENGADTSGISVLDVEWTAIAKT